MQRKFAPCVTQECYSINKYSLLLTECFFVKGRRKTVELQNQEAFLGTFLTSKAFTDSHLKKEFLKYFLALLSLQLRGRGQRIQRKLLSDSHMERFLHFRNHVETKYTLAPAVSDDCVGHNMHQQGTKLLKNDRCSLYRLNDSILLPSHIMKTVLV